MQQSLQSLVTVVDQTFLVELFGYTTKGLPGLEIVGLGPEGRRLKEKLIYLCRMNGWRLSPRRYVLCLESPTSSKRDDQWLELPFLVLYLKLGGLLPLGDLREFFCAGKLQLDSTYTPWSWRSGLELKRKLIGVDGAPEEHHLIELEKLPNLETKLRACERAP